jgi:uncharacterized membrane protein
MDAKRFWRHALMSPLRAARAFPMATLEAIEKEVARCEVGHRGEICFVVEAELTSRQLWHELSSRDRARELFALRGVWNTEENNGVLIYLLLADRRVEIVADRGVDAKVGAPGWEEICRMMQEHFRADRFEEGSIAGVRAVSAQLQQHFPARDGDRNELPDRPILI